LGRNESSDNWLRVNADPIAMLPSDEVVRRRNGSAVRRAGDGVAAAGNLFDCALSPSWLKTPTA